MKFLIYLLDDDKNYSSDLILLMQNHYDVKYFSESNSLLNQLSHSSPDVVLLDLMLNGESGLDVLKKIKNIDCEIPIIIITDYSSVNTATEAIKLGAFDYVPKTLQLKELKLIIEKAFAERLQSQHASLLENEISKQYEQIVGTSEHMKAIRERIHLFAQNDATVLITGESGVGKELVSRQIHTSGSRGKNPFIAINCSAIPGELIESELFGHEKGAFTGATNRRLGKFELASAGTLFLDEISEMPLNAQVKLLRVLQEREFERVGGNRTIRTDARIIAATNRNLEEMMNEHLFRSDLFYRLNVLQIEIHPLRKRKEDIEPLTYLFLKRIATELKKNKLSISADAMQELKRYNYPGNARELYNVLMRAAIICKENFISPNNLNLSSSNSDRNRKPNNEIPQTLDELMEARKAAASAASRNVEKIFLEELLQKFEGNITRAAEHIGINRTNLHKMIKKSLH